MKKLLSTCAVAVIVGIALSACGGGSSSESSSSGGAAANAPPVSGTVATWIAGFKQATASGDCAKFKQLGFADPCPDLKDNFANRAVGESATFGSGAVVDLDKGETAILFITDGKWKMATVERFGHPSVGTVAKDQAPFKTSVDATVDGLRTKNCKEFFHYAQSPPGQSAQSYCGLVFASGFQAALSADRQAKFTSSGGTADVQFYTAPVTYKGKTLFVTYPVVHPPHHPAWDLTVDPGNTPPGAAGA